MHPLAALALVLPRHVVLAAGIALALAAMGALIWRLIRAIAGRRRG